MCWQKRIFICSYIPTDESSFFYEDHYFGVRDHFGSCSGRKWGSLGVEDHLGSGIILGRVQNGVACHAANSAQAYHLRPLVESLLKWLN